MRVLRTVCGLSLALASGAATASLVVNGGFEADALTQGGGLLLLQTAPTGWVSLGGAQNVDLIGSGYFGGSASEGSVFLDLIGNSTGTFPSGVRQSISLSGGTTYRLSFDYNGGAPLTVVDPTLDWSLGSLAGGGINVGALNVFAGSGRTVTPWQTLVSDIDVVSDGSYWLQFSTAAGNSGGPYIDNVRLDRLTVIPPGTVDAPATLALVGLGMAGLAATRRRERSDGQGSDIGDRENRCRP